MTTSPSRTAGLDTLRAAAISLVFVYHYMCFVSGEPTFGWASTVGWVGVDLFFVLSGYLIANALFKGLAEGQPLVLWRFYLRRAFRTLPVFWLVLAASRLFASDFGGNTPPPLWRFLTFTQNLGLQPGTTFSHAWSLCVEEQFYLVLPLVLVFGARFDGARHQAGVFRLTRWHGWALMAALVALGMAARGILWSTYGRLSDGQTDGYMTHVYYATLCRFDEFIPGVAVAMLKNFHRPLWERAMVQGRRLFAAGLVATIAMLAAAYHHWIPGHGYSFFMTTFGYSLLAMAFGLLVVAALSSATALHRVRIPGAGSVALWSYSIYLSHRPVANVLKALLKPLQVSDTVQAACITVVCIGVGALLYLLVELPFMRWRDRLVPSSFGPGAGLPQAAAVTDPGIRPVQAG